MNHTISDEEIETIRRAETERIRENGGVDEHVGLFCAETDERVGALLVIGYNGTPVWGLLEDPEEPGGKISGFLPALRPFPMDPRQHESWDQMPLDEQRTRLVIFKADLAAFDKSVETQQAAGFYEDIEDVESYTAVWSRKQAFEDESGRTVVPRNSDNEYLADRFVMICRVDKGSPPGARRVEG